MESASSVPEHLKDAIGELELIVHSYLMVLFIATANTRRDPNFSSNHLLFPLFQDLLESATSLRVLGKEGMRSVLRRELRFLVEASIKLCFVQQRSYQTTLEEKLVQFNDELRSSRISLQNIKLYFLPEATQVAFVEEVGRLYGKTSSYVHWTSVQIAKRLEEVRMGRTVARETADDVEENNQLIRSSLAASLVLIFHSVPSHVAGDWIVEPDGSTTVSYFLGSRYLADIDAFFDYKAERQDALDVVRHLRAERIWF